MAPTHAARNPTAMPMPNKIIPPSKASPPVPRTASLGDLDDIVDCVLAAMETDPTWRYRYPHRHQYPEEIKLHVRKTYSRYLENKHGNWKVMVVSMMGTTSEQWPRTVSVAVWRLYGGPGTLGLDTKGTKEPHQPNPAQPQHYSQIQTSHPHGAETTPSSSPARVSAFHHVRSAASSQHFTRFRSKQIHLLVIATTPGFRCLGCASALVKWGMEMARAQDFAITAFCGDEGYKLYSGLGFVGMDVVEVGVKGEGERVEMGVCVFVPGGEGGSFGVLLGD